ncbi:MAG: hypothetical protein GY943_13055 [Chloroflexi bacterium]|nr:hypothetical protein [Chloroflexota bacterium]
MLKVQSVFFNIFFPILLIELVIPPLFAQENFPTIVQDEAWVDFPESVDFHLVASAEQEIQSASLAYGVESLSCGAVTAVTTPTFTPTTDLDITWRWPVIETQLIPPGSQFWWQWTLTLADGSSVTLPKQSKTYLDDWFVWQSVSDDSITVNWYRGPHEIGEQLLDAAQTAVSDLAQDTGLHLTDPINLYIYDESFDLQASLPGAPAWAGGAAFPEHNVILIAANIDYLDYGISTTRHEVGHLVVGRLTFNCTNHLPTWLNEGLAMVAEGEEDLRAIETLQEAVDDDTILTLPQLEGSFSIHTDRALQSYAQSYSLVRYLIETYGQTQMLQLLQTFQAGATPDEALLQTYGIDTNGLEDEWRIAINANPRPVTGAALDSTPTAVPTLAVLSIVPTAETATETPIPTKTAVPSTISSPAPTETAVPTSQSDTPTSLPPAPTPWGLIGGAALLFAVGIGIFMQRKRKS